MFLGVWKSSLPRSGKEREAAFLMHSASERLSVGAEAVVLVVRMGASWLVRVSVEGQILVYVLGLVPQGTLHGGMEIMMWWLSSWRGSGAGSKVRAFSSAEEPALDGFVALRVLQKIVLFSQLVDVSLSILNCS